MWGKLRLQTSKTFIMKKLLVVTALILFAGVAFGQTLKKGAILGIHETTITLKPDVTMDQLLDFLTNKWYPEINKLTEGEGVEFFLLRCDRGEKTGNLAWGIYCESEKVRNTYWPGDGSGSGKGGQLWQKMGPLNEELSKLITYENVGGDWKVL
jgi:hypothetical protein